MSYFDAEDLNVIKGAGRSSYVPETKKTDVDVKSIMFYSAITISLGWTILATYCAAMIAPILGLIVLCSTSLSVAFTSARMPNRVQAWFTGWVMSLLVSIPFGLFGVQKVFNPAGWNARVARNAAADARSKELKESAERRRANKKEYGITAEQHDSIMGEARRRGYLD